MTTCRSKSTKENSAVKKRGLLHLLKRDSLDQINCTPKKLSCRPRRKEVSYCDDSCSEVTVYTDTMECCCDCPPDLYARVLGPTADETILNGLERIFELFRKIQRLCCKKEEAEYICECKETPCSAESSDPCSPDLCNTPCGQDPCVPKTRSCALSVCSSLCKVPKKCDCCMQTCIPEVSKCSCSVQVTSCCCDPCTPNKINNRCCSYQSPLYHKCSVICPGEENSLCPYDLGCYDPGCGGDLSLGNVCYAITRITKYSDLTTYEIMQPTKQPPKRMPSKVDGIFVLRKKH